MNIMLEQFNLPRYIDGLSFADASKRIQYKFKDRTDPESINTEKEMLDRLKQMQEHVKAQQEAQEEPERSGGDLVAGSEGMPLDEEEITQEYNQEQGAEEDLMSQIQSAYGGNQYAYGGPGEEIPATKANITSKVVGLTGIETSPTNENMDFDTKQIVRYQPGVTSGETGKSGFYLYSKNAGEPGFDPLRHREFVNQEEMTAVQRTPQWKAYMQGQSKMALGGDEEDLHSMPETAKQRFSPVIPANDQSISSSIMSLAKTASSVGADGEDKEETNDFEFGGDPSEYYQNNNPYFTTNPGQINPKVREEGINPQTASQLSSVSGYNPQSNPSPSMGPATSGISDGAGKAAGGSGPGVAGYAQMGATAIELGQEAFGPTGVDTSGRVKVEGKKAGNAALAGAAKGASAGMVLGPWGAAAGAVIGGAAGFFGAKKQQKDANIANRNATYADAAVNDSQFAEGGNENPFGPRPKSVAETLMAVGKNSNKPKYKPAVNFDSLDKEYRDFKSAKMDTISRNNQVVPSGKYIKLNGGRNKLAEVDTALIDAVEAAEKRAGLKRGDLGATINRESNYGGQYGKGMNYGKEIKKMGSTIDLLSMSNNYKGNDKYVGSEPLRHFADLKAPGVKATKDFHGQYYQISDKKLLDEYIRKNPKAVEDYNKKLRSGPTVGKKNSLDFLADDMKAVGNTQKYRKQYNPGDKNYANLMEQDAKDLANEKAYNQYLDKNKFALGGEEMNRFDGGGKEKGKAKPKSRETIESVGTITPAELKKLDKIYTGKDTLESSLLNEDNYVKESKLGLIKLPNLGKKQADKMTAMQKLKLTGIDVAEFAGNNKDALRYAPAIGNIMQLANLKKPEQETTPELSTRYKKNVVDEQGLVNLVREETAGNREAILSSSEGSGNAARANLLGTQLNATKALSDAFMKSQEANARENAQEQSFNLGVDTTNLQQQTLAQDIRARNKGAYDTEKSRLKTAIGADLGGIGQEELYKKFPELMGSDYDWKGKYKKLLADQKLKDAATE